MIRMTTCWWAARRLDRYLDADPSAPLDPADAARVEQHAATCRRCARDLAVRRRLREDLRAYDRHRPVDAAALERLGGVAVALRTGGEPA